MGAIRLIWLHLRVMAMNEMQYRVNFFLQLFQSLLALGTGLVVLALVYGHVDELRGWTHAELLVVLGVYTILYGAFRMIIRPSLLQLIEAVDQGTLDHVLAKPVDAQLLVSIRMVQIWRGVDIIVGAIVLGVGIARLDIAIGILDVLGFGIGIVLGSVVIYSFLLMMTTTSFWIIRADRLIEMFEGVFEAARWPVGIYPNWMRFGLSAVVPVGFAVTVPAEGLTGRLNWWTLASAIGLAAVLAIASRLYWRAGLRHYGGASA